MITSNFLLANVGIGLAAGKLVANILLLLPIILIEGGFITKLLKQRYTKAILVSTIANVISTLVGIILGFFALMGTMWDLYFLAGEWLVGFLLTILLEFFVLRQAFKPFRSSEIWKVTIVSNIVTYLLLITVSIGVFDTYRLDTRQLRTSADMRAIGTALGSYLVDYNYFPLFSGNWKNELVGEKYYQGVSKDSWGEPFRYDSNGESYTLISYGKNRIPGGGNHAFDSDIAYINGRFAAPASLVLR